MDPFSEEGEEELFDSAPGVDFGYASGRYSRKPSGTEDQGYKDEN